MAQSCTTLEGINGKSNFCELNRAVKRTFCEAINNPKLSKLPKYQVLTKPIGSIGVDKSQCTNETVIFGKLEVSNEDFTICPYNPLFFPNVHWLCQIKHPGGWEVVLVLVGGRQI